MRRPVTAANLNILAQAASFGDISVFTLVPPARTVATVSKTYRKKCHRAQARLTGLVAAGMLVEGYAERHTITDAGRVALLVAGYVRDEGGSWLKPGARRPGWAP